MAQRQPLNGGMRHGCGDDHCFGRYCVELRGGNADEFCVYGEGTAALLSLVAARFGQARSTLALRFLRCLENIPSRASSPIMIGSATIGSLRSFRFAHDSRLARYL